MTSCVGMTYHLRANTAATSKCSRRKLCSSASVRAWIAYAMTGTTSVEAVNASGLRRFTQVPFYTPSVFYISSTAISVALPLRSKSRSSFQKFSGSKMRSALARPLPVKNGRATGRIKLHRLVHENLSPRTTTTRLYAVIGEHSSLPPDIFNFSKDRRSVSVFLNRSKVLSSFYLTEIKDSSSV